MIIFAALSETDHGKNMDSKAASILKLK